MYPIRTARFAPDGVTIVSGASSLGIRRKAIEAGMMTLRRSGLQKIKDGVTTIE